MKGMRRQPGTLSALQPLLSRPIQRFSASPDRLTEDVLILPVVVPELKFGDVERQILGADLVEGADNAAFENRPEALDRVGVDRADNVLVRRVPDHGMRVFLVQPAIA